MKCNKILKKCRDFADIKGKRKTTITAITKTKSCLRRLQQSAIRSAETCFKTS